jgi:hypothetical protein
MKVFLKELPGMDIAEKRGFVGGDGRVDGMDEVDILHGIGGECLEHFPNTGVTELKGDRFEAGFDQVLFVGRKGDADMFPEPLHRPGVFCVGDHGSKGSLSCALNLSCELGNGQDGVGVSGFSDGTGHAPDDTAGFVLNEHATPCACDMAGA